MTVHSKNKDVRGICVLVTSVFAISICGFVYELLISSLSSYLFGSSILHFSLTLGLFMTFMGVGSYLSKFITEDLLDRFILIETAVGVFGGLSAFLLFFCFSLTQHYYLVAFLLIASISVFIGLEIPIMTRILQRNHNFKDALANILAFDYLGALIGAILFPIIFLPYLGLMKTAFVVGMLNVVVALANAIEFRNEISHFRRHVATALIAIVVLSVGFCYSFRISSFLEKFIYQDEIILSEQTPYQKLVVTQFQEDVRLFIDGNIQFSSLDEHRYHEPLVHVPLSSIRNRAEILVLGGGDGMVVREVLKYEDVQKITLVDIDKRMLELGKSNRILKKLNENSLSHEKVKIVADDAYNFLLETNKMFSAIIIDLPDPNSLSLGKLYSAEFYKLLEKRLAADGVVVTQSTSPYFARLPFWSIHNTLLSVFEHVIPYSSYVPSFGQWGFNMASRRRINPGEININVQTKFLTEEMLPTLFVFDKDMSKIPAEVNKLNNQVLVSYYEDSWDDWN